MNKLRLGCLSATVFLLINSPIVPQPQDLFSLLNYSPEVQAKTSGGGRKSSGGRSRGGSFKQAPSKSGNDTGSDSGSSGNNSGNGSNNTPNNAPNNAPGYIVPVYSNPNPVIITNGSSSNNGGGFWVVLVLLILGGGTIALVVWWLVASQKAGKKAGSSSKTSSELDNEIVTVTCLQIALLAEAREIQADLIRLATEVDLTTPEGLVTQLQESALALLRTPENWTHGRSTSQTVASIKSAETLFERLSIAERQKFATETLVNVGGNIRKREIAPTSEPDIAEYIVVTLLVGTADDQPLFPTVHTEEDLKSALSRLGAVSADYLMVFELLWTPAEEGDSLTYDQLLANYADMRQLI